MYFKNIYLNEDEASIIFANYQSLLDATSEIKDICNLEIELVIHLTTFCYHFISNLAKKKDLSFLVGLIV